jgi:hypothetical protein
MKMYKQKDYESAFADFKKNNAIEAAKYQSEHSDTIVLAYLMQTQRLPTQTTVQIAIQELVRKGLLFASKENLRTVRALAQKGLDAALANAEREPLTKAEMDEFAGLSFADLQRKYWGDEHNRGARQIRSPDESDAIERLRRKQPVSRRGAWRRGKQSETFVITERIRADTRETSQL